MSSNYLAFDVLGVIVSYDIKSDTYCNLWIKTAWTGILLHSEGHRNVAICSSGDSY